MAFKGKQPETWTVSDVTDFLGDLGFGHVAPAFKDNGVDGPFLMVLSEADMQKELGLQPLQARKVLMALTAAKEGGQHAPAPAAPAPDTRAQDQGAAPQQQYAAAPVAPPPAAAAPGPPAPVGYQAPPPAAPVQQQVPPQLLQAQQLLGQADAHLAKASGLLAHTAATQAAQTGAVLAGGRRGFTGVGLLLDASQKKQTNQAGELSMAAMQSIDAAKRLVPDLPIIRLPQVQATSGVLVQGLTSGPVFDAVRTGKAKMNRESVDTCRADLASARQFLSGRIAAATPAPSYAPPAAAPGYAPAPAAVQYQQAPAGYPMAPPPQQYQQQPPKGYYAAPHQQPMAAAAPPPAGRTGGGGGGLLGAAVAGAMLANGRERRRERRWG